MALLRELRMYIKRRKDDPKVETAGAQVPGGQPAASTGADTPKPSSKPSRPASGAASDDSASPVSPALRHAPRPEPKIEPRLSLKSKALEELQQGNAELRTLAGRIVDHLDARSGNAKAVDDILDRLPATLDLVPELNRQSTRIMEVLGDQIDSAQTRATALTETLGRITDASQRQQEVLGMLHQQLETGDESSRRISESLEHFRSSLQDLEDSHRKTVKLLSDMSAAAASRANHLEGLLGRAERWMMGMIICCGGASIVAIVLAVIAIFS